TPPARGCIMEGGPTAAPVGGNSAPNCGRDPGGGPMSGFSPDWLALREPADHASINAAVRAACVRVFAGRDIVRIVDLGCGTGSNLRSLAPALGVRQHWSLIDNDPALLEIAGTSAALSGVEVACKRVDLASVEF